METLQTQFTPERQRLQEDTARAAKLIADVKRLKADLEAQRNFLAAENERRQREVDTLVQSARMDAEKRLGAEKSSLEVALQRKQDELDRETALRTEAEEMLLTERQRLSAEAEGLRAQLAKSAGTEASQYQDKLASLEASLQENRTALDRAVADNSAVEARLAAQRQQFENQIQSLKAQIEANTAATQPQQGDTVAGLEAQIAEIRQILDTEFARNAALVELARQERAAGEATRRAISEKAEQLVREYRERYDRLRNQEETRMREERRLIEAERDVLRGSLDDVLKLRDDLDAARRGVEEQAARLRAQQTSQIDAIEAEALASARRLREREQIAAQDVPETDEKLGQEWLERTYDFQNQLRKQLQMELNEWLSKQNPGSLSPAKILEIQQQNIDRIRRKADEIRDRAQSVALDFDVSGDPEPDTEPAPGDSAAG